MDSEQIDKNSKKPIGKFYGFDHITFFVSNAKQAASFYITRMGFNPLAYAGLETGDREKATHVVKNGKTVLVFVTPLNNKSEFSKEHSAHVEKHGDAVKDIAFTVEDCTHTYNVAVSRGAKSIREPFKIEDKNGVVIMASISPYGDTIHTFVERKNFNGTFLPGFNPLSEDPINGLLGPIKINFTDHIVSNHGVGDLEPTVEWYEKMLDFHVFWSVDDSVIHTEFRYFKLNYFIVR